jgi:hypothetical protein
MQEDFALVECLADELELLIVEVHDRLLEVPNAAMDKLGRLGGRPCVRSDPAWPRVVERA